MQREEHSAPCVWKVRMIPKKSTRSPRDSCSSHPRAAELSLFGNNMMWMLISLLIGWLPRSTNVSISVTMKVKCASSPILVNCIGNHCWPNAFISLPNGWSHRLRLRTITWLRSNWIRNCLPCIRITVHCFCVYRFCTNPWWSFERTIRRAIKYGHAVEVESNVINWTSIMSPNRSIFSTKSTLRPQSAMATSIPSVYPVTTNIALLFTIQMRREPIVSFSSVMVEIGSSLSTSSCSKISLYYHALNVSL